MYLALAIQVCPRLFCAQLPEKVREVEWKDGKTGGFISYQSNIQMCEIQSAFPICLLENVLLVLRSYMLLLLT